LKERPPAGHAGTARDSDGQTAENRGLVAVADGPDRPQADPECQSVSALIAGAIAALDRGDVARSAGPTSRRGGQCGAFGRVMG
jgi:hypothetical protein